VNGGDHNDGKLRLLAVNTFKQRDSIAILHDNIGQDEVKGTSLKDFQTFATAGGELDNVSLAFEGRAYHGPDVGLVVYHEDACRSSLPGIKAQVGFGAWNGCGGH
jgi:hypothetical protein